MTVKNRFDIAVSNLAELATVHVAQLRNGANAWVEDQLDYWTLNKNGTLPIGPDVIAPLPGSPIAGAAQALWERQAGGAPGVGPSNIVYRQGAVNPEAPVYGSFAAALVAATSSGAEASIEIDPSLGQPVVPSGSYVLPPGLTLAGILGNPATLEILQGATFSGNGLRVRGGLTLEPFNNTNQIIVVPAATPFTLVLDEGSGILMSGGSTGSFLVAATGATVNVLMDQGSSATGVAAAQPFNAGSAPAGYTVAVGEGCVIGANAFGGAGNITLQQTSPAVSLAALASTVILSPVGNGGILAGTATLVTGATPAISAPGLKSTSKIVCTLKTAAGVLTLTTNYAALVADRTFGIAGTFKLTAVLAAGTINVADLSTLDWIVII